MPSHFLDFRVVPMVSKKTVCTIVALKLVEGGVDASKAPITPILSCQATRGEVTFAVRLRVAWASNKERVVCLLKGIAEGTYKTKHAEQKMLSREEA